MTLRVIFMGTPEFAVPSLDCLAQAGHELLVVTQPARPAGRGRRTRPSPVGERAAALGLPVIERHALRDAEALTPLVEFQADFLVVVAFGLILRRRVLELARWMPINLHPSRLPALRGVAPIPWTIWLGERHTAVTTMRMDRGVDTGDILLMEEMEIGARESAGELAGRLAVAGAELLVRTLVGVVREEVQPVAQPAAGATYAPRLVKAHGHLDWSRPAPELDRLIRAMSPWPGARALYHDAEVTIRRAMPGATPASPPACAAGVTVDDGAELESPPGTIVALEREGIEVVTGEGRLRLLELQPAGKGIMSAAAFARGRHLRPGERFDRLPAPPDLEWPRPLAGDEG